MVPRVSPLAHCLGWHDDDHVPLCHPVVIVSGCIVVVVVLYDYNRLYYKQLYNVYSNLGKDIGFDTYCVSIEGTATTTTNGSIDGQAGRQAGGEDRHRHID